MEKTLSAIGNSLGLIIEKPILDLLNIDKDTRLEIRTDGEALIIRPVRDARSTRVTQSTERMMDLHDHTREKLAE